MSINPLVKYLTSKEDQLQSPLVVYNKPLDKNSDWQSTATARVWVKRDSRGAMALVASCTHLGCEVTYHPDRKEWLCPCHGSIYDVEGRPLSGPAPKALQRAAVEIKPDGSLMINTAQQVGMDYRA
ncbi:ubiquinol-cytochrome c reductase iron-sulfur subunit [Desulfosporosinus sp. BG]|uniref:QcrA and Rieske domain-containing protein n=1 Tax=Desulfosporosinus sp. BG TaxID=1633135 RepID=UPI001FA6F174|nr:ubiquinol-cytochrome c reductase iron-sulfur subunit [Desulfosporosinus sp. BG]